MFQLTKQEFDDLRPQFVTSSWGGVPRYGAQARLLGMREGFSGQRIPFGVRGVLRTRSANTPKEFFSWWLFHWAFPSDARPARGS